MRAIFILIVSSVLACAQLPPERIAAIMSKGSVNQGLGGWWALNEGYSTNIVDSSPNHNNGAIGWVGLEYPLWTNGIAGSCLYFTGFRGWVSIPHNASLNAPTTSTVSAWIKTTVTAGVGQYLRIVDKDTAYQFYMYANSSNLGGYIGGLSVSDTNSGHSINDGNWHHVAMVYDGSHKIFYVDGVSVSSTVATGSPTTNTAAVTVGADVTHSNAFWTGFIDSVRIYTRALSATEILKLYKIGKVVSPAP